MPEIQKVLILCPKSPMINWQREADKWLTRKVDLTIINYDVLHRRKEILDSSYDLCVIDESQYIKNPKAIRTKAALGLKAKHFIFLTGTPIENKPIELWPIVQKLDPTGLGRSYVSFGIRYCAGWQQEVWTKKMNPHTKRLEAVQITVWNFDGSSNLDELQEKMRAGFMVRRLKKDVLTELPAKRRQIIPLPADGLKGDIGRELNALKSLPFEEAVRRLEQDEESPAFTAMSATRQKLGIAKAEAALDHIKDVLENEGKVIVFAHHKEVISLLNEGLRENYGAVVVDGSVTGPKRQAAVDQFQTDPGTRVFIGSIRACGTAITLTAASTVIFVEQDWVPGRMAQAEDRAHRIGQQGTVLCQYLVFDGSLDAHLCATQLHKQGVADSALDTEHELEDLSEIEERIAVRVENRERHEKDRGSIKPEHRDAILANLRRLSGVCDGAVQQDGVGFNGLDSAFGKRLAQFSDLTLAQAHAARRMLIKYRRQLGTTALAAMFEEVSNG